MASRCVVLLLACAATSILAQSSRRDAPPKAPDFSTLEATVRQRVDSGAVPSVSIAVARNGRIIWEYAYGFANLQNHVAATPATSYYLASVSKVVTATAVMQLAERKVLDLDRPANEYLRDAKLSSSKWDVRGATVRRLANHTAGLPTYDRSCYMDEPQCTASGDDLVRRYGVLVWPPSDHFDYSNAGYGILGEIIAHTSGESLAEYLRAKIFKPTGMSSCFLGTRTSPMSVVATRYQAAPAGKPVGAPVPESFSTTPAGSSIYCSARDLALFGMLRLKDHGVPRNPILSDHSIDEMDRSPVDVEAGLRYSFGWWMQDNLHGFSGIQAQGGTSDATAYLQLVPSEDVAVAVLSNTGTSLGHAVLDDALAVLLPKYGANLQLDRAKPAEPPKPEGERQIPSPGVWSGFIQTYAGRIPLELSADGRGSVRARIGSGAEMEATKTRYKDGVLNFQIPAILPIEDPWVAPYVLRFELHRGEGSFTGAVTTSPTPEAKHGALLSFWVELKSD